MSIIINEDAMTTYSNLVKELNDDKEYMVRAKYLSLDEAAFSEFNSDIISAAQYAEKLHDIDLAYEPNRSYVRSTLYADNVKFSSENVELFHNEYDVYRRAYEVGLSTYNSNILFGCGEAYSQKSASAARHAILRWVTIYRTMPNKIVFCKKD